MNEPVEYRDIEGFPGYRVGSDGSVWSRNSPRGIRATWRRLSPCKLPTGHLHIDLYRNGTRRHFLVHRLVLTAFVGLCPEGKECCHNDGDPANNTLPNLRWDTHKNNKADQIKHGRATTGERNGIAKLTREQVLEIRARFASGGILQRELGREYGVDQAVISEIVNRHSWQNI